MTPNPLTGVGLRFAHHLHFNFIAVRTGMLGSRSFRQYWENIGVPSSYEEAILSLRFLDTSNLVTEQVATSTNGPMAPTTQRCSISTRR